MQIQERRKSDDKKSFTGKVKNEMESVKYVFHHDQKEKTQDTQELSLVVQCLRASYVIQKEVTELLNGKKSETEIEPIKSYLDALREFTTIVKYQMITMEALPVVNFYPSGLPIKTGIKYIQSINNIVNQTLKQLKDDFAAIDSSLETNLHDTQDLLMDMSTKAASKVHEKLQDYKQKEGQSIIATDLLKGENIEKELTNAQLSEGLQNTVNDEGVNKDHVPIPQMQSQVLRSSFKKPTKLTLNQDEIQLNKTPDISCIEGLHPQNSSPTFFNNASFISRIGQPNAQGQDQDLSFFQVPADEKISNNQASILVSQNNSPINQGTGPTSQKFNFNAESIAKLDPKTILVEILNYIQKLQISSIGQLKEPFSQLINIQTARIIENENKLSTKLKNKLTPSVPDSKLL